MADVLPPKRQAVFDRLRRRIESYRRHQNDCIPRFDQSFNGVVEQNIQDTLVLKQRFLESKAKRAAKKSDKKPSSETLQNNVHSLPTGHRAYFRRSTSAKTERTENTDRLYQKFTTKRSASEEGENGGGGEGYSGEPPPKQPTPQEGLTKFSVEIVQQLEFTTTTTNSQISTNVTVKALNTSVKSDLPRGSDSPEPKTAPSDPDVVECKREPENPEFVDLEQCAAALEKDANGGNSFPVFTDLIGDDTSEAIITSDAFKDLISEISDFNPEFMRDFDFDGGESRSQHEEQRRPEVEEAEGDRGRGTGPTRGPGNFGLDLTEPELSPAAQTLKQMAEHHQHKTRLGMEFDPTRGADPESPYEFRFDGGSDFADSAARGRPFKRGTPPCTFSSDEVKREVFSGGGSPAGYGEMPSPGSRLGSSPFDGQYSPYANSRYNGRPQQQPPPPSLRLTQAQRLQISQSQGQQIQVSLAQNVSAEVKNAGVSIAQQQGIYGSAQDGSNNYCSVSQSQTINFTQQTLRQRTPSRQPHQLIRNSHPGVDMMQTGQVRGQGPTQLGMRPAPPEYNKGQSMLHAIMSQRFPTQPRMLPLQPMPPSGPMMRAQQQYIGGGNNVTTQPRMVNLAVRSRQPTPIPDSEWRQMILQQSRPQFHQAQGVNFATSNSQISAGQIQHMSRMAQHQSLAMHHSSPPMSVNLQMNQTMGTGAVFNSGTTRQTLSQLPSYSAANYSNQPVSSSYTSSGFNQQTSSYQPHQQQTQQQQNTIPSDFSLDFLEQLPSTDPNSFSEQELLSSLESGTNFNLQDIL